MSLSDSDIPPMAAHRLDREQAEQHRAFSGECQTCDKTRVLDRFGKLPGHLFEGGLCGGSYRHPKGDDRG